jgi:ribosomal protein S18 acetylase RimI-like enzyme
MTLVREITADDWELLRDVRLAALSEAPYAFGSTYAREAVFTQETWRGRVSSERSVTFFARQEPGNAVPADKVPADRVPADRAHADRAPAGLAGVYVEDGAADLVSMWVRPAARGLGVGEALVAAAASWAKANDFGSLFLRVTESNGPARRLYERCGFSPTGESEPLPSDPALPVIRVSLAL